MATPHRLGAIATRSPTAGIKRENRVPTIQRMRPRVLALVLIATAPVAAATATDTATAAPSGTAAAAAPSAQKVPTKGQQVYHAGRYIVSFTEDPLASYDGSESGYPATRPARGRKLDTNSAAAKRWQAHLVAKHDAALARVGASKIYDYTVTNNGVAVQLTAAPGHRAVEAVRRGRPRARRCPARRHHLLSRVPGPEQGGRPLVAARRCEEGRCRASSSACVDTGIWPESTAFAGGTGIPVPADWHGQCVAGENFPVLHVQRQARRRPLLRRRLREEEHLQGRVPLRRATARATGRTPHRPPPATTGPTSASTATDLGKGSGMAPGAKVAAYKVCWTGKPGVAATAASTPTAWRRSTTPSLDGVDVINYSIGGSSASRPSLDSVEMAFRGRPKAGVFVANSAGNSGPGHQHPRPPLALADHGGRRDLPARLPGGRARQRRPLRGRLDDAVADHRDAARHLRERQARPLPPIDDAALCFAGSLDPAQGGRQGRRSATAASTPASTRASRSSGPAASASC